MTDDRPTQLFDRRTGQVVPAVLHVGLSAEQILAVEAVWGPERDAAVGRKVVKIQRLVGVMPVAIAARAPFLSRCG